MTRLQRGAIQRFANAWDGLRSGQVAATTTKAPLANNSTPIMEVIVQNDPGSQNNVAVGDTRYQQYILTAGSSVTVPVNDLATVYVRAVAGTATVNFLAGE